MSYIDVHRSECLSEDLVNHGIKADAKERSAYCRDARGVRSVPSYLIHASSGHPSVSWALTGPICELSLPSNFGQ